MAHRSSLLGMTCVGVSAAGRTRAFQLNQHADPRAIRTVNAIMTTTGRTGTAGGSTSVTTSVSAIGVALAAGNQKHRQVLLGILIVGGEVTIARGLGGGVAAATIRAATGQPEFGMMILRLTCLGCGVKMLRVRRHCHRCRLPGAQSRRGRRPSLAAYWQSPRCTKL